MKLSEIVALAVIGAVAMSLPACKNKAKAYADTFEATQYSIESSINNARDSLAIIDLGGPEILDSEDTDPSTGKKQTMRQFHAESRNTIARLMRSLNPPPAEHRDAFERLRELYAIYERHAQALLDTKTPQPISAIETELLDAQVSRIKTDLNVIMPRTSDR